MVHCCIKHSGSSVLTRTVKWRGMHICSSKRRSRIHVQLVQHKVNKKKPKTDTQTTRKH